MKSSSMNASISAADALGMLLFASMDVCVTLGTPPKVFSAAK
jgi:hypothetical protein